MRAGDGRGDEQREHDWGRAAGRAGYRVGMTQYPQRNTERARPEDELSREAQRKGLRRKGEQSSVARRRRKKGNDRHPSRLKFSDKHEKNHTNKKRKEKNAKKER